MADFDASLPDAPGKHATVRQEIEHALESAGALFKASMRPLPTQTGDGSYLAPPQITGLIKDLQKMGIDDAETLIELVKSTATGEKINDKSYFMERLIKLASELPVTSKNGVRLTNSLVNKLWSDLQHPPSTFLGEEYIYRRADGSNNNIVQPQIGAANTPYARTVRSQTVNPAYLPDPGTIFDSVMVRKDFTPHPNKISSVLFYLASIIIHDHSNFNNSQTSSYLDLSPLYGSNEDEQSAMRTHKDGKIKKDCFSEKRLLGFPPGVGVLLIMFNRFHNSVVEQLAQINDSGRFNKPKEGHIKLETKYDNDLFQTGRLITCGLYINCILKDYVRTILNLNRTDSVWDLDPRASGGDSQFGGDTSRSVGNQVSAEFNLVYRWHAAVSKKDDRWTQQEYKQMFPDKDPANIEVCDLLAKLREWGAGLSANPQERPFANLSRGEDGSLSDDDLVKILADSVEDVAGAFGANKVPQILRSIEILGINQARSWNLATLNEFRTFFGLTKHETFESINKDAYVADQLKHLYEHPDFVELYPGLVVEDAKEPQAGSGLCPSYTVSRAILSDAVALVRGDRFYMIDYTPKNLTHWGYNEVNYDVNVDQGHVFYKLFLRAFPNHIQSDSVYAHFPLVVPSENKIILSKLGHVDKYDFKRPSYIPPPTVIQSYDACTKILDNKKDFNVTWGKAITFLMHNSGKQYGADFMLSGDFAINAESRQLMNTALYRHNWDQEVRSFYERMTLQLLHEKSYKLGGINQVDIVRDIGNLVNVHFAAEVFSLPLKTKDNPRGIYSEAELYDVMALVFMTIFFDVDPMKSFPLKQVSRKLSQQLGELVEAEVKALKEPTGVIATVIGWFHQVQQRSPLSIYGTHMIKKLLETGLSAKDLVWSQLLPSSGAMVANQGQLFAQCLDYYLSEEGAPHLKEINRLAKLDTVEADELILRYFLEGSRLKAVVALFRDPVISTTVFDGEREVKLEPGQKVLLDLITASHDPAAFPEPEKVRLDRPLDSYIHFGWGPHICLGYSICKVALTTMLKTVCKLDNLRRAPGPQGHIKQVADPGGITKYMTADESSWFPFPTTMKVRWDGDLPPLHVQ
ncbi:hypothetical protein MMC22_000536 [Lobaria immixta]|nr:hypothetical protein [Lobaria immixta]